MELRSGRVCAPRGPNRLCPPHEILSFPTVDEYDMNFYSVLIGIEYHNTHAELPGCHNDVKAMAAFLVQRYKCHPANMIVLWDEPATSRKYRPTKSRIQYAINKLKHKAQQRACTNIFLYYSGHGTSVLDTGGDEKDGRDEALVPCDFAHRGVIKDDWLKKCIRVLPSTCICRVVVDACHSGTVLDLDDFDPQAQVLCLSGCADSELSNSVYFENRKAKWAGALTTLFIELVNAKIEDTPSLLRLLRERIHGMGLTDQNPVVTGNVSGLIF